MFEKVQFLKKYLYMITKYNYDLEKVGGWKWRRATSRTPHLLR